jgi:hypothetical protein
VDLGDLGGGQVDRRLAAQRPLRRVEVDRVAAGVVGDVGLRAADLAVGPAPVVEDPGVEVADVLVEPPREVREQLPFGPGCEAHLDDVADLVDDALRRGENRQPVLAQRDHQSGVAPLSGLT